MTTVAMHLMPNNYDAGQVGTPGLPMLASAAAAPGASQVDAYGSPECTVDGVVCGSCSDAFPGLTVRHASADHVRACWEANQLMRVEAVAEIQAERQAALYWDGGYAW